jgi:hypothetical protein
MTDPNKYPEHTVREALLTQRFPPDNGWFERHERSVPRLVGRIPGEGSSNSRHAFEEALCYMLHSLAAYAGAHVRQYGSPIAEDGVLGVAWRESLAGLRQLLNGELGQLDGGTLDHAILELYKAAGFEGGEP